MNTWYAISRSANQLAVNFNPGATFTLAALPTATLGNRTGYDLPTFTWSAVPVAHHYWLYVLDTTTNVPIINRQNITATTYTTPIEEALTPGHSYIWYVITVSTNGQAANFQPGQAFSLTNVAAPTLNGPFGVIAASTDFDRPTFSWNVAAGAHHYWLYVVDLTTGLVAIDKRDIDGTSYQPPAIQALTPGHQFIWHVISMSTNNLAVNFLPGQTFSLTAFETPILTSLASPTVVTPTLQWSEVPGATRYAIYIYDLDAPQAPTNVRFVDAPSTSFTPTTPLMRSHRYRWWVAAVGANGAYTFVDNFKEFTVEA